MSRPPDWIPPEEFDGYRLVRDIGRGGMGQVYLGYDSYLDRPVAVKFLVTVDPNSEERERFLVEARAFARLQHPNVVSIYRVGEVGGRPYIISEFIRGQSLDQAKLPLPWAQVLKIGIGLARGLAAAHRRGVLHRDIKPANALLSDDGEVKLLDFGLAKLLQLNAAPATPGLQDSLPSWVSPQISGATLCFPGADSRLLSSETPTRGVTISSGPFRAPTHAPLLEGPPEPAPLSHSSEVLHAPLQALTQHGMIVGTPLYMAPEVLLGEPASYRSDVYSLGALLFQLCTGQPPYPKSYLEELREAVRSQDAPPVASMAQIDSRLGLVIDRCLCRDLRRRYASGDELLEALEQLSPGARASIAPEGDPYRGLHRFEAEHRGLFFGRDAEVRALLERMRTEPFVLVAGTSGVGKSSTCRAGVLPAVIDGALDKNRSWSVVPLTPGKHPLIALARALAPHLSHLSLDEDQLALQIKDGFHAIGRELRRQLGPRSGILLFIDQLEELLTQSEPEEAQAAAQALGWLAEPTPGVRLLATVRGDFLARLASLKGLGDQVTRALYLLRPLSREGIKEAIVGPARGKGYTFESEALVEALVDSTARTEGGLPLLQFALGELWSARDEQQQIIPARALEAIGGVGGALSGHADGVLAALLPAQRLSARRIMLSLVGADGLSRGRSEDELVGSRSLEDGAALDALVHGRLLVVREAAMGSVYEVAHEALISGWSTLRRWIEEDADSRLVRERLSTAIVEWERLGCAPEALWRARQLAEIERFDAGTLTQRELGFIAASKRQIRRERILSVARWGAIPVLLGVAVAFMLMLTRLDLEKQVTAMVRDAESLMAEARAKEDEVERIRKKAFALFDARELDAAERTWTDALEHDADANHLYTRINRGLEHALLVDASRTDVRALFSELLYTRAVDADAEHQLGRRDELLERLVLYDQGGVLRARWNSPGHLAVESRPAATVTIEPGRGPGPVRTLGATPLASVELPPGSYVLTFTASGRATVRYPLLLRRTERLELSVDLPPRESVPAGFAYVPAGRFLFGSGAEEGLRRGFLSTVPMHDVLTGSYLIAQNETTYAEWLEYLAALSPAERGRRTPAVGRFVGGLSLKELSGGRWEIQLKTAKEQMVAKSGEKIRYSARKLRAVQDWLRFPVSGVSYNDAEAYATWLATSGKVPGARICEEPEWERAARGADGREYPHGDQLSPDDANYDETYGRDPLSFGMDEVGSHPASRSPFMVDDLAGNVWEWARSTKGEPVARGGAYYYDQISIRSTNRQVPEPTLRDITVGVRICASLH